jgi:hypothetical protein
VDAPSALGERRLYCLHNESPRADGQPAGAADAAFTASQVAERQPAMDARLQE